ncbi:MAG: hydrogenase nickel incorporation protein HypB [Anaerolineaceae bacterium]|jgi:hydrogenase nickel incorporation protein HypB|nr:hydrogenase nickel incorporation protein HypB [Anaerolineaceae bacterium]HQJ32584.1 hydrogenase nickel incorporation protein HypB [Anaerolineaceae bacterium]
MPQRVEIVKKIMDSNDRLAQNNQAILDQHHVYGINLMASPGAGKTSVILETIKRLPAGIKLGVIEGDTAPVTIDSDKIAAAGISAVQINTGGECHLDANMIEMALAELPLEDLNLIMVENVGNLICPAAFQLGTHANVLIASVPEGDDKPYKYPNIYRGLDVLIINKIDLTPYIDFRMDYFQQGVEMLNPGLTTFALSAKTGEGFDAWIAWLTNKVKAK